jgi:hypothetical protein
LSQSAQELANAATQLAEAAEIWTDLQRGASAKLPDLSNLDARVAAFRAVATQNATERRELG